MYCGDSGDSRISPAVESMEAVLDQCDFCLKGDKITMSPDSTYNKDIPVPMSTSHNDQDQLSIEADNGIMTEDYLTLDQLHDDVILSIAAHVDPHSLCNGLGSSCDRFYSLFGEESYYWKNRISHQLQKPYPAVETPDDFSWVDACSSVERIRQQWSQREEYLDFVEWSYKIHGVLDSVHLLQDSRFLLTGDRSRTLNVLDLSKIKPGTKVEGSYFDEVLVESLPFSHSGWIWQIASNGNQICTGSWDCKVRLFEMDSGKLQQSPSIYRLSSPVLSLYMDETNIIAGVFDKKTHFIDRRSPTPVVKEYHKNAVLCCCANEDLVITGSEDKTVQIFDRKAGKVFKSIKVENSYAMSMDFQDNQLWFGDRDGILHLYDATDGLYEHVGSYDVGHTDKITGVQYSRGGLFTCSADRTIKVLEPTRDPAAFASINNLHNQIGAMDYRDGVLASAIGDVCVAMWIPKHFSDRWADCYSAS